MVNPGPSIDLTDDSHLVQSSSAKQTPPALGISTSSAPSWTTPLSPSSPLKAHGTASPSSPVPQPKTSSSLVGLQTSPRTPPSSFTGVTAAGIVPAAHQPYTQAASSPVSTSASPGPNARRSSNAGGSGAVSPPQSYSRSKERPLSALVLNSALGPGGAPTGPAAHGVKPRSNSQLHSSRPAPASPANSRPQSQIFSLPGTSGQSQVFSPPGAASPLLSPRLSPGPASSSGPASAHGSGTPSSVPEATTPPTTLPSTTSATGTAVTSGTGRDRASSTSSRGRGGRSRPRSTLGSQSHVAGPPLMESEAQTQPQDTAQMQSQPTSEGGPLSQADVAGKEGTGVGGPAGLTARGQASVQPPRGIPEGTNHTLPAASVARTVSGTEMLPVVSEVVSTAPAESDVIPAAAEAPTTPTTISTTSTSKTIVRRVVVRDYAFALEDERYSGLGRHRPRSNWGEGEPEPEEPPQDSRWGGLPMGLGAFSLLSRHMVRGPGLGGDANREASGEASTGERAGADPNLGGMSHMGMMGMGMGMGIDFGPADYTLPEPDHDNNEYWSDEDSAAADPDEWDDHEPDGLYRAAYPFEPEGINEMAVDVGDLLDIRGRGGGGDGWVVAIRLDTREEGLVPEGYLEAVGHDEEPEAWTVVHRARAAIYHVEAEPEQPGVGRNKEEDGVAMKETQSGYKTAQADADAAVAAVPLAQTHPNDSHLLKTDGTARTDPQPTAGVA